ncbi:fibronectin type III domain-containing protein [Pelotomaculum terephthalicicum JT]|uniref:fibronectin type III domain-containing protein n=1 Tax=Pelotomaculum TaxID=191373 RepID=UPI0009CD33B3|nr:MULTISPECIES: fibronectin type III domain-containing protein [Pelotomaculum]MCG9968017.1 fibronectin type III domain-containing protein [Pelotomaculum terephthalicicum JT]OPX88864.1 MAG: Amylopullulanase precursor [Pelotomaculum sp. PtaB.Bin117]OPY60624.1 MAG: Amylopullulanase precursor [Pelotomaculum sp. PtaU1.Bin065]
MIKFTLTWDSVPNATCYNVKRATTSGGPYEVIATSIKETTYIDADTDMSNGTTYYYVVSAVTADGESGDSNEISATVADINAAGENGNLDEAHAATQETESSENRALMVITMVNGIQKEYDLTMAEVDAFIKWYSSKPKDFYEVTNIYNSGPFLSMKEYIVFDKILSFEVMEYIDN